MATAHPTDESAHCHTDELDTRTDTDELVVTWTCQDRPGIVHAVTGACVQAGGNLTELQQFASADTGNFFMRLQVEGVKSATVIKQALRDASRQDGRIEIIDETLDRREMLALIQAADCYTSLHRAEGFGLGMAEAMALGKPVIATASSGNAEFVTPETAYAIPYKLRDVPPDGYVYPEGQVWAEPDEAACAAAMAQVFGNQAEAQERAHAGQAFIARRFGPANVGKIVATRLAEIFARLKL